MRKVRERTQEKERRKKRREERKKGIIRRELTKKIQRIRKRE